MYVMNERDRDATKIESYPYRGKPIAVKDVWIKWLTQAGPEGSPEYGLRFFRVGPGGEIPIHNHLYYQTMYILSGHLTAYSHNEKDEVAEAIEMGPNDFIFVPTMEPHSMRNLSETEDCTFLCCIANVYED